MYHLLEIFVEVITGTPDTLSIICAIAIPLVMIVVAIAICMVRRKSQNEEALEFGKEQFLVGAVERLDPHTPLHQQAECLPYDTHWEFPQHLLTLGSRLGTGAFGEVFMAQAKTIVKGEAETTVAVKRTKADAGPAIVKSLGRELKVMMCLGRHVNIVNLLGACTKDLDQGKLLVITEYCALGNLRDYLLQHRSSFQPEAVPEDSGVGNEGADPTLNRQNLLCWSFQVARGMEYLCSKQLVHGDLAARNVLLAADNVAKICDFGLTKNLYYHAEYLKESDTPVPIKWLAIESLRDRVFSTKSDVWSFGVTLWELFSLGQSPYPGVIHADVLGYLLTGRRLDRPDHADEDMYSVMQRCWAKLPANRPAFSDLVVELGTMLESGVRQYYLQMEVNTESEGYEIPRCMKEHGYANTRRLH